MLLNLLLSAWVDCLRDEIRSQRSREYVADTGDSIGFRHFNHGSEIVAVLVHLTA